MSTLYNVGTNLYPTVIAMSLVFSEKSIEFFCFTHGFFFAASTPIRRFAKAGDAM